MWVTHSGSSLKEVGSAAFATMRAAEGCLSEHIVHEELRLMPPGEVRERPNRTHC